MPIGLSSDGVVTPSGSSVCSWSPSSPIYSTPGTPFSLFEFTSEGKDLGTAVECEKFVPGVMNPAQRSPRSFRKRRSATALAPERLPAWVGDRPHQKSLRVIAGGLGEDVGEQKAQYCGTSGDVEQSSESNMVGELGHQEHTDERTEFPTPAATPCPVVRMLTGKTSEGSTNVVMFGPNSVNK